jgi:SOS response regulatory protein OraA/RecX
MTIKFQCIDESHAIVAALRMKGLGRKTVRLGRAVICEGDWCQQVTTVAVQNMAHTLTPTKYDLDALAERGEL